MASSSTSIQQHYQHPAQPTIVQATPSAQQHQQQHQQQQQQQQQHQHQPLPSNLVGRELKLIASTFVKQYYTLLNKAPCFIHNFYNHDSTFIHGTIEMGSDNHTEPVVGREKIEEKMKELQLNDCRAKIKQIDCLETLAGGLVMQVIGELSNDGKPMRRFLQTFVLAPSPDQTRHDGDSHTQNRANDNRRGVQISENSTNSSHNQKFYVLNSIFRYQDDGADSEFEDDVISVKANTSLDNGAEQINNEGSNARVKAAPTPQPHAQQPQQQLQQQPQQAKVATPVEQPKSNPKPMFASDLAAASSEQQKRGDVKVVAPNGIANLVRKSEMSEKASNENGRAAPNDNQPQPVSAPTSNAVETSAPSGAVSQTAPAVAPAPAFAAAAPVAVAPPAPRPSNEPKTWANMVRNTMPPSPAVLQSSNVAATKELPSLNQSNQAQTPSQQQQIPDQHHHHQQSSQSHNEHQQNNNTNNNMNTNNNNRRRHTIRKTSNNKTGNGNGTGNGGGNGGLSGIGAGSGSGNGRMIKNRPPRPATAVVPTGKPAA